MLILRAKLLLLCYERWNHILLDLNFIFFRQPKFHLVDRSRRCGFLWIRYFPNLTEPIGLLLWWLRIVSLRKLELCHFGLNGCWVVLLDKITFNHVAVILHVFFLFHGETISCLSIGLAHVFGHFHSLSKKKERVSLSLWLVKSERVIDAFYLLLPLKDVRNH